MKMEGVLGKMRFLVLSALAVLSACAGQQRFGTFVELAKHDAQVVAADAARRVAEAWPAERHSMQIGESADEPFARALIAALRQVGFRVFTQQGAAADAVELHFAVDTLGDSGLLRVTLYAQHVQWSRAYRNVGGELSHAGPWTGVGGEGGR